eukprot:scaffold7934_cov59-Attheya_sp.AAC.6
MPTQISSKHVAQHQGCLHCCHHGKTKSNSSTGSVNYSDSSHVAAAMQRNMETAEVVAID